MLPNRTSLIAFCLFALGSLELWGSCYHPSFRQLQCGDGLVEGDELCDDGNNNGLYGYCNVDCSGPGPFCGDGVLNEMEECDDSNTLKGDGCDNLCKKSCGNGILDEAAGEQCDHGINNADTNACTSQCKLNVCGDAFMLAGEEACDDGGNNGLYGYCNADCSGPGPFCGDGVLEKAAGEQCDNGTINADTGVCTSQCKLNVCGDALILAGDEECDEGELNADSQACTSQCTNNVCGDSLVFEGVEICDDGINDGSYDGCMPGCQNLGPFCGDGMVNGTMEMVEECDDGNALASDGCEPVCTRTLKEVVAGEDHTCALYNNGKIRCWGRNDAGQLGYGNTQNIGNGEGKMPPADVDVGGTVIQLAAGEEHTCALLDNGNVRCWGRGNSGQLGYGNTQNIGNGEGKMPPADVNVGKPVVQLAAGEEHTCALLDNGNVRCWGRGNSGQLGYGNTQNIGNGEGKMPPADVAIGGTVAQIAAGSYYTCALLDNGDVRCWGAGSSGQLGYGNPLTIGDDETPASQGDVNVGKPVVQLAAGEEHTCALLDNGNVRCWGRGNSGQLGYGDHPSYPIGDDETPASQGDVNVDGSMAQIAAGNYHTCALLNNDKVRCWGWNDAGQLGYGNQNSSIGNSEGEMPPADVNVGRTVIQLAAGWKHTCALLDTGQVRCWGYGQYGQLGYGNPYTIGDDDNELPSSVGPVPLF